MYVLCSTLCVSLLFASLCYFHITRVFLILFLCLFSRFVFLFSTLFISRFVLFCVLFLLRHIAVSFLILYKFTDHCHQVETQLQSIDILSYIVFIVCLYRQDNVLHNEIKNTLTQRPLFDQIFILQTWVVIIYTSWLNSKKLCLFSRGSIYGLFRFFTISSF
jgi:hypothetical protein